MKRKSLTLDLKPPIRPPSNTSSPKEFHNLTVIGTKEEKEVGQEQQPPQTHHSTAYQRVWREKKNDRRKKNPRSHYKGEGRGKQGSGRSGARLWLKPQTYPRSLLVAFYDTQGIRW